MLPGRGGTLGSTPPLQAEMSDASPPSHVPLPLRLARALLRAWSVRIVAALLVLYFALGYFAVGPLLADLVPRLAQSQLDSRATVRRVAFDPLRLQLTVDDFRLSTAQGVPLAGFDRLFIDFDAASLWRWAWSFHQIRLDRPQVNFAIARGGAMNWDGLLHALQRGAQPARPSDRIVRLVIRSLLIRGGVLQFADANRAHPYVTRLAPLNVRIDMLSTLPQARADYAISLLLPQQKATLRWTGYVGINPPVSGGRAELSGLDLAAAARAVPQLAPRLQIAGGTADVRAAYSVVLGNGALQWAVNQLQATLSGVDARAAGTALHIGTLQLGGAHIDGAARTAVLQTVAVHDVHVTQDGARLALQSAQWAGARLDWRTLQAAFGPLQLSGLSGRIGQSRWQAASVQTQPGSADGAARRVRLPQLAVHDMRLQPASAAQPWLTLPVLRVDALQVDAAQRQVQAGAVQVDASALRLARLADGRIDLLQALGAGAPPAAAAPAAAPGAAWQVALQRVAARVATLDYTDHGFAAPLQVQVHDAQLDTAVAATLGGASGTTLRASDLQLRTAALRIDSAGQPLARWGRLQLAPTQLALSPAAPLRVQAGALQIADVQARLRLGRDGLNWARALQPAQGASSPAAAPASAPPQVSLQSITLRNVAAQIDDTTAAEPIRLDIVRGLVQAQHLSLDLHRAVPLQLHFALQQGGQFSARGSLTPAPLAGDFQVQLQQLALPPFGGLLKPYVRLRLTSGTASASGTLRLQPASGGLPQMRFDGRAQVDNLALVEPQVRTPFLGWRKLAATGLNVQTAPLAVHVLNLQAVEPYGRIVLNPDHTLNVQAVLLTRQPVTAGAAAADASLPLALRIDRTAIDDADVDFTDLSIKPEFRVRMQKLSGVINGLSDAPGSSAQIVLDGQVNDYGQVSARGRLQPFRATNDTDVTLDFRNLDMAAISPYSGKFAGRTIESGRLDARLQYKIVKAQMQGDNQFTITRLKLGPHVDSPDAINLPLDLAIAVLENSQGVIDLNLPVHGDLDNPKFSYGGIIWQAIVNVLSKIVTAPFRALGALFGGGEQQVAQAVQFAPGSAVLAPPEREALARLAQALAERPRLDVQVPPTLDTARDTAALQQAAVRRAVLHKLGVDVAADANPGPLDLGSARTRNAIEALYLDQHPTSAYAALKRSLPDGGAKDHALLHAMLQQLEQAVTIPRATLDELALARARAVVAALTCGPKALPAARVHLAPAAIAAETASAGVTLRLELVAGKGAAAPHGR